jgi:diguanylate cyclase (GGDEF)-like protein
MKKASFFGLLGYLSGRWSDKLTEQKNFLESRIKVLESQSMTDDVTGLYNHRHILEEIEREIERAVRQGRSLCGMMIDIDNFKRINDVYGHWVGDLVLREMAFVLKQTIRVIDIVGRYGGDEFVVILPETKFELAERVAQRIQQQVRQHRFKCKGNSLSLTVSIGLWLFENPKGLTPAIFVDQIDKAMFAAKGMGKDRIYSVEIPVPL